MIVIVGFSYQPKWLSKLIRVCTKSPISHTYIRQIYNNPELMIHASHLQVGLTSFTAFKKENTVYKEYVVNIKEERIKWLYDQTDKSYGFLTLVGFCLVLIGKLFKREWKNPWTDGERSFICSELVAETLELKNPELVTPKDLLDYLEKEESWPS